jgi:hypothetical protein
MDATFATTQANKRTGKFVTPEELDHVKTALSPTWKQ